MNSLTSTVTVKSDWRSTDSKNVSKTRYGSYCFLGSSTKASEVHDGG